MGMTYSLKDLDAQFASYSRADLLRYIGRVRQEQEDERKLEYSRQRDRDVRLSELQSAVNDLRRRLTVNDLEQRALRDALARMVPLAATHEDFDGLVRLLEENHGIKFASDERGMVRVAAHGG